jgi:hypothetical protein
MANNVLFLVGASGSGKTAVLRHLRSLPDFPATCYFFDDVGVPSQDELRALEAQAISWQANATRAWIEKLAAASDTLAVLEGQTTPSCIADEVERVRIARWLTVLLDCDSATRQRRLTLRDQPELANPRMNNWAAYLRGQADALRLPIIDTSSLSLVEVGAKVRTFAERLLEGSRAGDKSNDPSHEA